MDENIVRPLLRKYIARLKHINTSHDHAEQLASTQGVSDSSVQRAFEAVEKLRDSPELFDLSFQIDTLMYDYIDAGEHEIKALIQAMIQESGDDPDILCELTTQWREHIEPRFDIRHIGALTSAATHNQNFRDLLDSWADPTRLE